MYHYSKSAKKALSAYTPGIASETGPLDHLRDAFEGVSRENVIVAGGATACGINLDSKGLLRGVK